MTTATLSLSHFDEIADTETVVKPIETSHIRKLY